MAYRVKFNGLDVWCDSVSEVEALASAAKGARNQQQKSSSTGRGPEKNAAIVKQVLKFLTAISKANGQLVGSDTMLKTVGCSTGSALGGVVSNAHRYVAQFNLPFDEVAVRVRKGDLKYWKAGPKIAEAIEKLQSAVSA